jgi:hypothetical protein
MFLITLVDSSQAPSASGGEACLGTDTFSSVCKVLGDPPKAFWNYQLTYASFGEIRLLLIS